MGRLMTALGQKRNSDARVKDVGFTPKSGHIKSWCSTSANGRKPTSREEGPLASASAQNPAPTTKFRVRAPVKRSNPILQLPGRAGSDPGPATSVVCTSIMRPFRSAPGHCQTNLNRPAKGAGLRRSDRKPTPLGQRGGTVLFEDIAAIEVTVMIEMIMDRGVDGGKLLQSR